MTFKSSQQRKAAFASMNKNKRRNRGMNADFDFPKERSENRYHATVFVPSTKDGDKPITEKEFQARIDETVNFMNSKFGGTTRVSSIGSFTLKSGRVVEEPVARVETFATRKSYFKNDKELEVFLKKKKKRWGQEVIGFSIETPERKEEELHFV